MEYTISPIKVIVVDDEPHSIDTLQVMLQKKFPEVEVLAGCNSVAEASKCIDRLQPELVFLDVEMPHQSGFDLLKQYEKLPFEVIFTTAYEKYAIRAIKFSALDYLLKPFSIRELGEALERYKNKVTGYQEQREKLEVLIENMRCLQHTQRKIALPSLHGLLFVQVQDIVRCESEGNYTKVYFSNKSSQVVSRSLKEFEDLLEEMGFFRVHHSHLINLQHLQAYLQGEGGFALMSDGAQVEISRRRKADFLKKTARF